MVIQAPHSIDRGLLRCSLCDLRTSEDGEPRHRSSFPSQPRGHYSYVNVLHARIGLVDDTDPGPWGAIYDDELPPWDEGDITPVPDPA